MKRAIAVALTLAAAAALAVGGAKLPWAAIGHSIAEASAAWLAMAAAANLASLAAKGSAWHAILSRTTDARASSAIAATVVGGGVGSLGPSVAGEAARLRYIVVSDGVPAGAALRAVVAARICEAATLAGVIAAGSALLPTTSWATALRWVAIVLTLGITAGSSPPILDWAVHRFAGTPGALAGAWRGIVRGRNVRGMLAYSTANWILQWAAYYCACRAIALPSAGALSLSALILSNLGGILRLTPGNLGVLQAAFALAAVAYRIPSGGALAASFVLQAIQIVPVIIAALVIVAVSGRRARSVRIAGAGG